MKLPPPALDGPAHDVLAYLGGFFSGVGPIRSCSAPGRDVHEARQSGPFAITAGRRLLVKAERIDDELLGCNS
jgi:hypothetical protein